MTPRVPDDLDLPRASGVLVYVPHGAIPDRRGFAPSIVACEFAKRMRSVTLRLVAAAESDRAGSFVWEGLQLERLPNRRVYKRLYKLGIRPPGVSLPRDFLAVCKKVKPRLVHVHQMEFDIAEFGRRVGWSPAVVLHAHVLSQRPHVARGIADHYIAVSDYVKTGLASMGYPLDRIATIRNGVDTRLFKPPDPALVHFAKKRLGADPKAPILGFIGRKHDIKGYPAFLAVAERLLGRDAPLFVLAVGADPERPSGERGFCASREREARLAEGGRFLSLPAMPQSDLAELYRAIDVTLLPSLNETQGMAVIESLAAGCVTISARVGGIPETITDGVTGLLVDDPLDTDALYEKTAYVLEHLAEFASLRSAARAYAVANLDWSVSAALLEALYQSILA